MPILSVIFVLSFVSFCEVFNLTFKLVVKLPIQIYLPQLKESTKNKEKTHCFLRFRYAQPFKFRRASPHSLASQIRSRIICKSIETKLLKNISPCSSNSARLCYSPPILPNWGGKRRGANKFRAY